MTKEQLLTKLIALHESDDYEVAHGEADTLLLKYIDDEEIAAVYEGVPKWYA